MDSIHPTMLKEGIEYPERLLRNIFLHVWLWATWLPLKLKVDLISKPGKEDAC